MILDESHARSLWPNVAQVKATRQEIWLLFGTSGKRFEQEEDLAVDSAVRVIVSPFLAKRLSLALDDVIRKHEAAYGSPDGEPSTRKIQPLRLPPFESARATEKLRLLFETLENFHLTVGFERSFKISEKKLLGNRFLLAFKPDSIRQNPHEKISAMNVRMGMPKEFLEIFEKHVPEATSVGFGIEEDGVACVVKAYLEFRKRYQEALGKGDDFHSYVSHLGFKWDAANSRKPALASYTCFTKFTAGHILERLSRTFYPHGDHAPPFKSLKRIVDLASKKVGGDKFLYIEVSEENNPRSSFDINMYGADLRLQDLLPFFMEMSRHYSIPDEQFIEIYDPVKTQTFGHLAGGSDRTGQGFLTIYFSED